MNDSCFTRDAAHDSAASFSACSLPDWMTEVSDYQPERDYDGFIRKSILSITSVLTHFRLDDGVSGRYSASAPMKIIIALACILMTSLSINYFFSLTMVALVLIRLCLLPSKKLKRVMAIALSASALSFVLMLPAIFFGQNHSAVLIATKVFISVGIAMIVALSTPFNQLTGALRAFHVPSLFIMTVDLTLKNIVSLGNVALEVLMALRLRSVGKNRDKTTSMGGVGGVVFLKATEASKNTFDAMTCRGFEGDYPVSEKHLWKKLDAIWALMLIALVSLFLYMQGAM